MHTPQKHIYLIGIAEHQEPVFFCLCMALRLKGYRTVRFRDSQELQKGFSDHQCDLLICDLQMPYFETEQLLQFVLNVDVRIPIILLSDSVSPYWEVLRHNGCIDLVKKPFTPDEVVQRIQSYLQWPEIPFLPGRPDAWPMTENSRVKNPDHGNTNPPPDNTMRLQADDPIEPTGVQGKYAEPATVSVARELPPAVMAATRAIRAYRSIFRDAARPCPPKIHVYTTEISALIQKCCTIVQNLVPTCISISSRTVLHQQCWLAVDGVLLQQVLLHLITNAIEAISVKGSIHVSIADYARQMQRRKSYGPYLVIEVSDNGIGIPPHVAQRMFEDGFSTKPHARGKGLFLANRILQLHHGWIDFESRSPGRTVFKIFLPRTLHSGSALLTPEITHHETKRSTVCKETSSCH